MAMTGGTSGKESTRRMFPQVGAAMSSRRCTVCLKIHVGATALRNQDRFPPCLHAAAEQGTGKGEPRARRLRYV